MSDQQNIVIHWPSLLLGIAVVTIPMFLNASNLKDMSELITAGQGSALGAIAVIVGWFIKAKQSKGITESKVVQLSELLQQINEKNKK